ncbi:MAG: hypothetical protein CMI54_07780 [Parcubacteria group bacterium]|nr:hypothetical protein [Parcubacteria group bacterium]|tara:strand:+ start:4108 stop:4320 length:213 start_codon:yes stop_codon:yes gene_type:complete
MTRVTKTEVFSKEGKITSLLFGHAITTKELGIKLGMQNDEELADVNWIQDKEQRIVGLEYTIRVKTTKKD